MVNCCFPNCKSKQGRAHSIGIRFHEIPAAKELRGKWLAVISRQGPVEGSKWVPSDHAHVCSLHFKEEDYRRDCKRKILKPGVVPSKCLKYPVHLQRTSKTPQIVRAGRPTFSNCTQSNENERSIIEISIPEESASNAEVGIQVDVPKESASNAEVGIQVDVPKINNSNYQKIINCRLRSKIQRLEKKLKEKENKLQILQRKVDANPEVIKLFKIKQAAKENSQKAIYLLDQINNFGKAKAQWSEQTIQYCMAWRIASPKGYDHGRSSQLLSAPSRSTLNRYLGNMDCDVGISQLLKDRLKVERDCLQPAEMVVSVRPIADKMALNIGPDGINKLNCMPQVADATGPSHLRQNLEEHDH